jgi:hypothetical protein
MQVACEHPVLEGYSKQHIADRITLIAVQQLGRPVRICQNNGRLDLQAPRVAGLPSRSARDQK